jgi:Cu2+-exporting ATPase
MFRKRFWWSLFLSIPVLIFSPMIQQFLNFTAPDFPGSIWIPFVFSLIIFGYGGIPFLKMAIPEIQNRKPGMMTLISLAISVAFVYSLFAQLTNLGEGFFWELVTLIDIMLLGHWLEMRSVRQASGALNELAKLIPDSADRIREDGATETVSATDLRQDDLVLVRPGASIPADGVVTEGESQVNESMITGESKPVDKSPEAKVIAGTINGEGSLRVRVTATGDETALAGSCVWWNKPNSQNPPPSYWPTRRLAGCFTLPWLSQPSQQSPGRLRSASMWNYSNGWLPFW